MTDECATAGDIEAALAKADPELGRVIAAVQARIGAQRMTRSRARPFEALARAIVYQSLSGEAAATIFRHLRQAVGNPFLPAHVVAIDPDKLVAAGLSNAKAKAVRSLADWFLANPKAAGTLPRLSNEAVAQALAGIPGVGPWTINVFLIFGLGRPDVMPAADLGIRRGVQLLSGLPGPATARQVEARAAHWRPYRSLASIYLWNAVKLKLRAGDLKPR
jgi:DNA-3-methyladenine glycosylase II